MCIRDSFTGVASGITGTPNITVAIMTATSYNGDGSQLTGVASTAFITNNVTASGSNTTIDLNNGNTVFLTQSSNTTIAFSNVGTSNVVNIIRTGADYTITWPAAVKWDDDTAPTLDTNSDYKDTIVLITRDSGTTWYGWKAFNNSRTGLLWVWGRGNNGELGQNETIAYSSPILVSGNTWSKVSQATNHKIAIKTDGTMWSWGYNLTKGKLGVGDKISRSSPTQVPGTNWRGVWCCDYHSFGTKTDGTLWAWGKNSFGELGLNQPHNTRYT